MKGEKALKIARTSAEVAGLLLLGMAWLTNPGAAYCQSKTTASARLYIQVNVVPILHSESPAQPQTSKASISFDLTNRQTQSDRRASTRAVSDQTISQGQPIVLTTVTLTAK